MRDSSGLCPPPTHLPIIEVLGSQGLDKYMGSDWAAEKTEDLPAGSGSADVVDSNRGGPAGDCPLMGGLELLSLKGIRVGQEDPRLGHH